MAAALAEPGIAVGPSTNFACMLELAARHEDVARLFRYGVGGDWSVDETYVKVAGAWASVSGAIDEHGPTVDASVSARRAVADAAVVRHRAIEAPDGVPDDVTTDGAVAVAPALAAILPAVTDEMGKAARRHPQGRVCDMRGFATPTAASESCLIRDPCGDVDGPGMPAGAAASAPPPPTTCAWSTLKPAIGVGDPPRTATSPRWQPRPMRHASAHTMQGNQTINRCPTQAARSSQPVASVQG